MAALIKAPTLEQQIQSALAPMILLKILSGKKAGTDWVSRHFPLWIGRSSAADLCLDEAGVWDRHLEITLNLPEGFRVNTQADASITLNGQNVQQAVLHNGDLIEIGLLKIQFGLSATRQNSLVIRERLTWLALAALAIGQIVLICCLPG